MTISKSLKTIFIALGLLLIISSAAFAMKEAYNYMSAEALNTAVQDGADVAIVDIQVPADYKAHHIKGAIETGAYPVKTADDKAKFTATLAKVKDSKENIVIICPRGKGGAERAVDYFKEQGVAPYRLFILTEGQGGWNYGVETN
ncbi:rhodanese-like domain-containing protein [Maridesulfovibrio sp. FT414]|uniref:rhodanese-like domain-containing protein n=1 Tax=Maridesulfovibrio sp. FT414 TaxID=2979469 RepID=UPI003D809870